MALCGSAGVGWLQQRLAATVGWPAFNSNSNNDLIRGGFWSGSGINSKILQQYFCNNIIIMKQILILYFCYFEPMSRWYTNYYANAGNGESWGNIIGSSLSLARRQYRTRYCTQYTVQSAHADGKERAHRQFGVGELNHGSVCYSGPTTLTWLPSGAGGGAHFSAEIGQKKNIPNWFADGGWLQVSASGASTRRLYELNYRQTALVDQLLIDHLFVTVQPSFINRHTWFRRFVGILVEWYSNCFKSLGTAKFNFNVPFFLMIAVKCYNIIAI